VRKWAGFWLAAVLVVSGIAGVAPPAAAELSCDGRVFAVEAEAGHLVEIPSCPEGFGAAVEVDSADWRGYHAILGVRDGDAAIIYVVTPGGVLWWRRQATPGTALSAPARVGWSVNWAQPTVFVSRAGYLHIGGHGLPVRTFRHQEWATGGVAVSEEANLFPPLIGPSITGLATTIPFAVGIWNGMNFRVWRPRVSNNDMWYVSGRLPLGVTGVVGDGYWLHAVNSAGEIVLLTQTPPQPACLLQDTRPWQVTATAPGHYLRVVVPVRDSSTGAPIVWGPPAKSQRPDCAAPGVDGTPWEWQAYGP
jgi:hypothetical protein